MPETQKLFNLIQSWGEFLKKSTEALPDPMFQIHKEALKMTCSIHAKYPARLLQAFPWNRAYMRGLCEGVGVPLPEPPPPPTGGQCVGVQYAAWGDGIAQVNPGSGNNVPLTGQGLYTRLGNIPLLPGKITKVQYFNQAGQPVSLSKYLSDGKTFSQPTYLRIYHSGGSGVHNVLFQNSWGQIIKDFRRADGQADLCGNAPPYYSDDIPIDPGDFTKIVNVYNYNPDGSIKFTIPVTITIPTNIGGGFDFDFSMGGVNTHIDLGGLHYGGTINVGGGTTNNITNNYGGGGALPFDPDDYEEEILPEPIEDEQEVKKPDIEFVLVTVDILPHKGKTILMGSAADNTFFAGYFRWLMSAPGGTYGYEEIPIRKSKQVFRNPGYTNGYRVYSVNGAVLRSTIYKTKAQ